jgi:predicted O-methyltransferase YrrM
VTAAGSEPGFGSAWAAVREIEGWMTEQQALMLFCGAQEVPVGHSIVEIGSHHGRSTIILARGARTGATIVAVDPVDDPRWGGGSESYDTFQENLIRAGVHDRVRAARALSEEALRNWDAGPIGMVYVDGAHDRATALADLRGWSERLEDGGLLVIHDTFSSTGVTAATLQRFAVRRGFTFVGVAGSLLVLRKGSRGIGADAALTARLVGRPPYFARNLAVKVALRRGWRGVCRALGHQESHPPY